MKKIIASLFALGLLVVAGQTFAGPNTGASADDDPYLQELLEEDYEG